LIGYIDNGNLKSKLDKSKAKCYNCPKISHYDRDCWSPTERVDKNANLVIEEKKEAILLLVHDMRIQDKEKIWLLDNEANNHMCGD